MKVIIEYAAIAFALWLFFQVMGIAHQADTAIIRSSPSGQRKGIGQ